MVKHKEKKAELFFVELLYPDEVKKNILLVLKDILEVLKRFEKFKEIRHRKLEKIHKLRAKIKEANKLFGVLKERLPKTSLRATFQNKIGLQGNASVKIQRVAKNKNVSYKTDEKAQLAPKKDMTELERLEHELNAIEDKLKGFGQ